MTVSRPDVRAIAWSPDSTQLAVAVDKMVQVHDVATGHILLTYLGHRDFVTAVAWSPDGSRLASGAYKSVHIWEAATGRLLLTNEGTMNFWQNWPGRQMGGVSPWRVTIRVYGSGMLPQDAASSSMLDIPTLSKQHAGRRMGSVSPWWATRRRSISGKWDDRVQVVKCGHCLR